MQGEVYRRRPKGRGEDTEWTGPQVRPWDLQQLAADIDWAVLPHKPARALLGQLALHANTDAIAWLSVRTLARRLGYAPDGRLTAAARASFWRTCRQLERLGLVRHRRGGPGGEGLMHFHLQVFAIADARFQDDNRIAVSQYGKTVVGRAPEERRTVGAPERKTVVASTTPVQGNTSTAMQHQEGEQSSQLPPGSVKRRRASASTSHGSPSEPTDSDTTAAAAHTGETHGYDTDDTNLTDVTDA